MTVYKPCPFCGWFEINKLESLKIGENCVCACSHCGALAIEELWDKRPIEDGLKSQIYDLESIMAKAKGYL